MITKMTPQERAALMTAKIAYKTLRKNTKLYNEKRVEMLSWFSESKTPNWGGLEFKPCK